MLRRVLCWVLMAVIPVGAAGADASAMLYGKGVVLGNGETIPGSTALFPGDLVETKTNSVANLNSLGSSVVIIPESLIRPSLRRL